MTVVPIDGVVYWYDATANAFVAPGRPSLPTGRDALSPGAYLPTPATAGLRDPSILTTVTGTTSYAAANDGQAVENRDFVGYVNLNGVVGQTFRNCRFQPPASGRSDRPTVLARNARNADIVFEDCQFLNTYTDPFVQAGFMGRGTTLRRCDIAGSVDGVGVAPAGAADRADVRIEACWIHDLLYVRPYSGQSDNQTHSDCIQWHGGPGLTLIGNRLEGFMDTTISSWTASDFYPGRQTISALMVNSSASFLPTGDMHVVNNWINGGSVGINMVGVPARFLTEDGSEIVNNHFGYDFGFGANSAIYCNANHVFALAGNHRWIEAAPLDTSIAFNTRTHG